MDIVHKARILESKIARTLSRATERAVGPSLREPLEIVHAIVDGVEGEIQPGGRGARVFPFNRVAVSVLAPSREARARLEAVLSGPPSLQERVVDRLQSAGCDASDLRVDVAYAGRSAAGWRDPQFHIAFDRVAASPEPAPVLSPAARVEIAVLRGGAERRTYTLSGARIDFGRGGEVRDSRNRLLRTNHVAFIDGSPENATVSRRHAHLDLGENGDCRLYDDGSVHGTGIVRSGRSIPVPSGSRGVRLRTGDEIVLGDARLRIRLLEA